MRYALCVSTFSTDNYQLTTSNSQLSALPPSLPPSVNCQLPTANSQLTAFRSKLSARLFLTKPPGDAVAILGFSSGGTTASPQLLNKGAVG